MSWSRGLTVDTSGRDGDSQDESRFSVRWTDPRMQADFSFPIWAGSWSHFRVAEQKMAAKFQNEVDADNESSPN